MPLASAVAAELRKLADSLEKQPNAEIHKPWVSFHCDTKEQFVAIVPMMPRPLKKGETGSSNPAYIRIFVDHETDAMYVRASVYKQLTCELLEPAKPAVYRCEPILSLEEDAALEVQA